MKQKYSKQLEKNSPTKMIQIKNHKNLKTSDVKRLFSWGQLSNSRLICEFQNVANVV